MIDSSQKEQKQNTYDKLIHLHKSVVLKAQYMR